MKKTVKAKIHLATERKESRLDYLYKEWNENVDKYNNGVSYEDRRENIDLHSAITQDAKLVDSGQENDHPVYLRSQIFELKYVENEIADWFVRIPVEPYENLWLPLKLAWTHEEDLENGEVKDSELCKNGNEYYLHINIQLPDETEISKDATFIGIDVGERNSLVSVALEDGNPRKGKFWSGGRYKQINKKYGEMRSRMQKREATKLMDDMKDKQYQKLEDLRHKQTRELIDYATQFNNPVIIMEDLTNIRDKINYGKDMNRRLHNWSFKDLQKKIEYKAKEKGIAVLYVDPRNTSKKCHNCLHKGTKDKGKFNCSNDQCPLSEYDRDLNAAINIAQRGASHLCENGDLRKDNRDDIQNDGAPLTVLQPRTRYQPCAG